MPDQPHCWCGSGPLEEFSDDYLRCPRCETLVVRKWPERDLSRVSDQAEDLYGRSYAESHLHESYGLPEFTVRSRNDLPERCAYWLRALLRYKLPPASVLELGAFHGGFVGLAQLAGFSATGLDVSPYLAAQAARRFGIKVLTGPVQDQKIPAGSLDVVALFDVVEHLQDPRGTLAACLRLLKPDGILVIQTPRYREGLSFADIQEKQPRFLNHFKPVEHLLLFSQTALNRLLTELGLPHANFEPAIFDDYDQFVFASRQPMAKIPVEKADAALLATPHGRFALALLDAAKLADSRLRENVATNLHVAQLDGEMQARWKQIQELTRAATELETRHQRFAASAEARVAELSAALREQERHAEERGNQIKQLEAWLSARNAEITQLTQWLKDAQAETAGLRNQVTQLTPWLKDAQAETADLRGQVTQLTQWLKDAQAETAAIRQAHQDAEKTVAALLAQAKASPPAHPSKP